MTERVGRSGVGGAWDLTNYAGVTGRGRQGYNGGTWPGSGIVTSQTAAVITRGRTTLGVVQASDAFNIAASATANFGGETVTGSSVLVKYTWMGDLNLSGRINGDDYFRMDNQFPSSNTLANGDFAYNCTVNADDYFCIDLTFAAQTGTRSGPPRGGRRPQ